MNEFVNLENLVRVKLTEKGARIARNHYDQFSHVYKEAGISAGVDVSTDTKGWTHFKLRELMWIFGAHMNIAHPGLFADDVVHMYDDAFRP